MDVKSLPKEAQQYIKGLESKVNSWETKYHALEERFKLELFKKYNRSSEKENAAQILLFDSEPELIPEEETNTQEVASYTKKKPGRKKINENLPREEVLIDILEEDKKCGCGAELVKIGEEIAERVKVIPEQMWVERTIRPKYACKVCEGSGDEDKPAVRVAPAAPSIIPKSIVTPELLAFLLINKYVDHLPFYRQEKRFERIGISISRQDMSNWQRQAYDAVKILFELMKEHIKTGFVLQMDETRVQVHNEPDRPDTRNSYMWLARGGPPGKIAILYEYHETRGSKNIHSFLNGFKGYLQTDGYEAYATALKDHPEINHVGCFAHARRKFFDASKVSKKPGSAAEGLKYIHKLYIIENELRARELSDSKFLAERKSKIEPVLEQFNLWLEKRQQQVVPSSELGKAIAYTIGQWGKLVGYLESPHLTPDNNACENAIRPFVLGRKNWLFAGSPKGAESSCGIYTLVETAKQNGLNPYDYLRKVFTEAPLLSSNEDWQQLLPWNIKLD